MMSHSEAGNASMLEIAQTQWNLSSNLVIPDGGLIDTASYFADLVSDVGDKKDEGFEGAPAHPQRAAFVLHVRRR